MATSKERYLWASAAGFWLVTAVAGSVVLLDYQSRPSQTGRASVRWPAGAPVTRDPARATLVMFVHPHCPCSRASMGELAVLMARCEGRVAAHVLFFRPISLSDDWARTDLWRSAAAIPGVDVRFDLDGAAARAFGAETSGYTVLYDSNGQMLFHGGITAGRGHFGDNGGLSAVMSLLRHEVDGPQETDVFGCSLFNNNCSNAKEAVICIK